MNQTGFASLNSTLNRQTFMSKLPKEQSNLVNKESKNLTRYREYQEKWGADANRLRRLAHRNPEEKTLVEKNVREVYVHPNHDKIAVLNDFVVHFWEMSLRNNNRILERHIKGHKFGRVELEELLQTDKGR